MIKDDIVWLNGSGCQVEFIEYVSGTNKKYSYIKYKNGRETLELTKWLYK